MTPKVAGKTPIPVEVEADRNYWWCTCGESKNQPFCDGSHKGGPFAPLQYSSPEAKKVFFCACKKTSHSPLCDGSHATA